MPRSHWEFHVQQAIDEYPVDSEVQRIGPKFLVLLAAIAEITPDDEIVATLDAVLAGVTGSPQIRADRDLMRNWLTWSERPSHVFRSLEIINNG